MAKIKYPLTHQIFSCNNDHDEIKTNETTSNSTIIIITITIQLSTHAYVCSSSFLSPKLRGNENNNCAVFNSNLHKNNCLARTVKV